MNSDTTNSKRIGQFLLIGKTEGYSYLVLLFIAMPLKYGMNMPEAVKIAGLIHGVLFVAFMYQILQMLLEKQFKLASAIKAFLLSIVPFGTFFLKKVL